MFLVLTTWGAFASFAKAGESVYLSWDSNPEPDIAGYRVHYGLTSGILEHVADTGGPETELPISELVPGATYYFAVLAYNSQGIEGPLSSEISYDVPLPTPTIPGTQGELPELTVESSLTGPLSSLQTLGPAASTAVGTTTVAGTITLHNRGKAKLRGLTLSLSGPGAAAFSISSLQSTTLVAGGSTSIQVGFSPTAPGLHSAKLRVSSNDPNHPQFDITLSGIGETAPRIAVFGAWGNTVPPGSEIAFGNVELGATAGRIPLTIQNVGTAVMTGLTATISGPEAADFSLLPPGQTSLAPGARTTLEVNFTPSAAGSRSGLLHLANDDPNSAGFDIALTASAVTLPRIVVEDTTGYDVPEKQPALAPSVPLGKTGDPITYTIRNSGTAPINGIIVSTSGPGAKSFSTTQPPRKSLQPGDTTTFNVTFHPSAGGWTTAKVRVGSSTSNAVREFSLRANGMTFPVIKLTDDSRKLLTAKSSAMDFGTRNLVDKRKARTITLKNTGSAPLEGLKFTSTGTAASDFKVVAPKSKKLAPGRSVRFKVYFQPNAAGTREATVRVSSNADGPPREFAVIGIGTAAPKVEVSLGNKVLRNGKAYADFGKGQIGKKGITETIIITNTGSADLQNLRISKSGVSPDEFSMSRVRTRTLAPGKSVRFKVTFRARKGGIRWADIRISSNDPDEQDFEIILTGTGTTQSVSVKKKKKKGGKTKASPIAPPAAALASSAMARPVTEGIEVIAGRKFRTLTISRTSGNRVTAADIEVSSDRVDWFSGVRHTTVLRDDADVLKVRDNTPFRGDNKRFIRLND